MAKVKRSWGQPRSAEAIHAKPYKAAVKRGVADALGERRTSIGAGTLKQRALDEAVRRVGGRASKAVDEARATAQNIRGGRSNEFARVSKEYVMRHGANGKTLLKGALRGMLSPAALAEGVAGSAAKAATHEKFKREARAESKPTKGGMKRVKTKA